jgi:hypothetical protein
MVDRIVHSSSVRLVVVAALASVLLVVASPPAEARSYRATSFDVRAELRPDRSLAVTETITFRFEEGTFTEVFREVPLRRTDGVTEVVALMDGVELPRGEGPGQVEVGDGPRQLRVRWHFTERSGDHVFELRYRLLGIVTQGRDEDVLDWHVLPSERRYRVDAMRAEILLPEGAVALPDISVRPAKVTTAIDGPRVVLATGDLARSRVVRVRIAMAGRAFEPRVPAWQTARAAQHTRGPWMLVIAVLVLVAGFGWLALFSASWRLEPLPGADSKVVHPPDAALPVGIASRLAGAPSAAQALAVLFDLARRGIVSIEEEPAAVGRGRGTYIVRTSGHAASLPAHERALLDVAFEGGSGLRHAPLTKVRNRLATRLTPFAAAIDDEMRQRGLLDPERVIARRTLARALVVATILVAFGSIGIGVVFAPAFGPWVAAVPLAGLLVVIGVAVAHGRFSVLTRAGLREARRWAAFRKHLVDTARGKTGQAATLPEEWLPHLVASGAAAAWARRVQKQGGRVPVPAWFHAAARDEAAQSAAFVTLLTTTTVAASSSGVHGGGIGGAAGGGGSGAR